MSYQLFFSEDALVDINESFLWYEQQREGLGEEFLESIDTSIDKIVNNPNLYQLQYKEQRAAILARFPYRIFYFTEENQIIIQGVFRMSRDPQVWQERNK
jgi:plasmid stabilization system protein ParE